MLHQLKLYDITSEMCFINKLQRASQKKSEKKGEKSPTRCLGLKCLKKESIVMARKKSDNGKMECEIIKSVPEDKATAMLHKVCPMMKPQNVAPSSQTSARLHFTITKLICHNESNCHHQITAMPNPIFRANEWESINLQPQQFQDVAQEFSHENHA